MPAPRPRSRRSARAFVLGVATAGVLVGCSTDAPEIPPSAKVLGGPDATAGAGVAQVTIDRFNLHAEGVVDLAGQRARLTVTDATAPGAKVSREVLVVGEGTWTRPSGATTWSVVDGADQGLLSLPAGLVSGDPLAAVALVRGVADVRPFGGIQVQQASTIRYDMKVDPAKAAAEAAGRGTPRTAAALTRLAQAVSHPVRVDCYLDEQGRIRRLELPEDLVTTTPPTRVDGNRVSTTIDFVRFGVPDQGLAPPA